MQLKLRLYYMRQASIAQGSAGEKQLSGNIVAQIGGEFMGASPKTTEFLKECMADSLLRLMKEKPFSKITVNEIAQAAGFTDPNYFSSLFRKKEGQSPLQYRKKFIKETEK